MFSATFLTSAEVGGTVLLRGVGVGSCVFSKKGFLLVEALSSVVSVARILGLLWRSFKELNGSVGSALLVTAFPAAIL